MGASSSAAGSSSSGGSSITFADFFTRLLKATCAQDERCLSVNGPRYTSRAACEADADAIYQALAPFYTSYFMLADTSMADACILDFAAMACDAPLGNVPATCQRALAYVNPQDVGGVCQRPETRNTSQRSCGWNAQCIQDAWGCGVCTAVTPRSQGETCNPYLGDCGAGLYCQYTSMTCQPRVALNGVCADPASCTGNLLCAPGVGAQVCKPRKGIGESCSSSDCVADLTCAGAQGSQICLQPLPEGATCSRSTTNPACKGMCFFASPSDATGTCRVAPEPLPGEPCAWFGGSVCQYPDSYAEDMTAGGVITGCTCRAFQTPGAQCTANRQCTTYACLPASGLCAAPAADGATCSSAGGCVSNYCNTQMSPAVCTAPPACP